jgi:hypothetical protein
VITDEQLTAWLRVFGIAAGQGSDGQLQAAARVSTLPAPACSCHRPELGNSTDPSKPPLFVRRLSWCRRGDVRVPPDAPPPASLRAKSIASNARGGGFKSHPEVVQLSEKLSKYVAGGGRAASVASTGTNAEFWKLQLKQKSKGAPSVAATEYPETAVTSRVRPTSQLWGSFLWHRTPPSQYRILAASSSPRVQRLPTWETHVGGFPAGCGFRRAQLRAQQLWSTHPLLPPLSLPFTRSRPAHAPNHPPTPRRSGPRVELRSVGHQYSTHVCAR